MQTDSDQYIKKSAPSFVRLNESWELNHWCEEFNLRADELRAIVKEVGPEVNDIRDYLVRRNIGREHTF